MSTQPWKNRIVGHGAESPDAILANPRNWRAYPDQQKDALKGVLDDVGWVQQVILNRRSGLLVDGHLRVALAKQHTQPTIPVIYVDLSDDEEALILAALDPIGALAETDKAQLEALLPDVRSDSEAVQALIARLAEDAGLYQTDPEEQQQAARDQAKLSLADRFLVPPFSVLDARQGYWQDRKKAWIKLGIASELGRGNDDDATAGGLTFSNSAQPPAVYARKNAYEQQIGRRVRWDEFYQAHPDAAAQNGTSIFDPVLCELAYRWFCPAHGHILDPFAGGSVRGIVAAMLGRHYTGIDLRPEQVAANEQQAQTFGLNPLPTWRIGDSRRATELAPGAYDFVFSCPPYGDLEVYSDRPEDLSTLAYADFVAAYRAIIAASVSLLKPDRFACFVVGDFRDPKTGFYRNFVSDTIWAFEDAGAQLYNEAILVTAIGSLAIRAGKQMEKSRKLGKTHQNVLVFSKGDPESAKNVLTSLEQQFEQQQRLIQQHQQVLVFAKGDANAAVDALGPIAFDETAVLYGEEL